MEENLTVSDRRFRRIVIYVFEQANLVEVRRVAHLKVNTYRSKNNAHRVIHAIRPRKEDAVKTLFYYLVAEKRESVQGKWTNLNVLATREDI